MAVGPADIKEERLIRSGVALDVIHRGAGNITLYLTAVVYRVLPYRFQLSVVIRFVDHRHGFADSGFGNPRPLHVAAVQGAIAGLDHPDTVLVKALSRGPALLLRPQVPFTRHTGGIAAALEHLRQGEFIRLQGIWRAADNDGPQPGANRVASQHERSPRRGAARLHQELGHLQALGGNGIDARGRHPAHLTATVGADITPADVISEHQYHIRRRRVRDARNACQT